jgi:hypothetical protein
LDLTTHTSPSPIHYYITDCGAFKIHANYIPFMCIEVNKREQNLPENVVYSDQYISVVSTSLS